MTKKSQEFDSGHPPNPQFFQNQTPGRVILHVDMDAFFAAVEQRDNPEYKEKPVIVGALPGHRGVVSAASYEARKYGIHSAMPISTAYQKCPRGIYLKPSMERYSRESHKIMEILGRFAPLIEQISVDEAFLDISGTEKLMGPAPRVAKKIQDTIIQERNLTASIGLAPNKFLAKIASDYQKPCGITAVPFDDAGIRQWLAPMPVKRMWGIGKKSAEVLRKQYILTIGDLQQLSLAHLEELFGEQGKHFYQLCRGIDHRLVASGEGVKSVSHEHTFGKDCNDREVWKKTLLTLSASVARRARKKGLKGRTVVLTWRGQDFTKRSKRITLSESTNTGKTIFDEAMGLVRCIPEGMYLRLIGVGITGFSVNPQLSLFGSDKDREAWEHSEKAVDSLIDKFGSGTVLRGGELG